MAKGVLLKRLSTRFGDSQSLLVVAEQNGELVGCMRLWEVGKPFLFIGDVFVSVKFRRKGIATTMFRHAREEFPDVPIRLFVDQRNRQAIRLYRKLGFVLYSEDDGNLWMIHLPERK